MDSIDFEDMKKYYSILGLESGCSSEDVKSAYRRLVKTMHPDAGGDPARFIDIKEAYDVLSNPGSRTAYDEILSRLPFGEMPYRTVVPVVISEPVDVFDDLVDVMSRRFGLDRKNRVKAEIILTESEANEGVNLKLNVPVEMICDRCFGFGGTIISDCRYCGGKGSISGKREVYLAIRPGAGDGDIIEASHGKLEIAARIKIER